MSKPIALVRDEIEAFYGSPLQMISECLRGFIVPSPGKKLISVDFSSIESRVLAWLAGEEWKLKLYREGGKIYETQAAQIFNVPVDKVTSDQRQVGKVCELAFGYQGGKGAFHVMSKNYGVKADDETANNYKLAWRASNPKIKAFWNGINDAAFAAVMTPGLKGSVGQDERKITYKMNGPFLFCRLPSGGVLPYPYARIGTIQAPWSKAEAKKILEKDPTAKPKIETIQSVLYKAEDSLTKQWKEFAGYGGLFTENVVQAISRDLLANALLKLDEAGFDLVGHVHDEAIVEVDFDQADSLVDEVARVACQIPPWAEGLPLAAGGWAGLRYRKG